MRELLAIGLLASASACTSSKAEEGGASSAPSVAAPAPAAANRYGTGKQVVKGGESFPLQGATVSVDKVTYLNNPCPPGAQCITSGIIKTVAFTVDANGNPTKGVLSEGMAKVVNGVMLRVNSVTAGPQAEIEASLPVAPAATP